MRKRFIHIAAALLAAAFLWPLDADARAGGGGRGGGGFHGGGGGFHGGGGGMRAFSGGGMRGGFAGSAIRGGGVGFAAGSGWRGGHRFHHHHGRFIGPAFAVGTGLALGYGAYAYDPYWYGYYDDDCLRWVRDWRYGWRQVNVCY